MLNLTENYFMMEGQDKGYKTSIKRVLTENYKDVIEYVESIIPAREMLFSKEQIDKYIDEIVLSVANTIKDLPNGIYSYIESSDPSVYYNIIAERITYGAIFLISKDMIASLLKVINPNYVFHYIKGGIVLPKIKVIIESVLSNKEKDKFNKEIEEDSATIQRVRGFLNAFIVHMDYEAAATILEGHHEDILSKKELIEQELRQSKLCIPDITYDLLFAEPDKLSDMEYLQKVGNTVKSFHDDLSMSHSEQALINVLKKYSVMGGSDNEVKIPQTIKEIRSVRGFNEKNIYIDDIKLDELLVVQRIMDGSLTDDMDISKYKSKVIMENFRYIKTFFNMNTDACVVEGNIANIVRNAKVMYKFKFRDPNMIKDHKSVFNIFKGNAEKLKNIFKNTPMHSVLTQAVIVNDPKSDLLKHKRGTPAPKTTQDKLQYRSNLISILKNKYAHDEEVRNTVLSLENELLIEPRFLNDVFKSSNFTIKNEKQALFLSVELDRIYKEAMKENA